jgi:UDP-GlcNAc:undecaprenyl-phosphate GlcNAc-1-phosphate transferase
MSPPGLAIAAAGVAFVAGLVITPWVRRFAHRSGRVASPSANRWHSNPTALLGGVAIVAASVVGVAVWSVVWATTSGGASPPPLTPAAVAVGVSALFMFAVGLVDDVKHLTPQLKFVLQALAGVGLVAAGATLSLTPWYAVNVVATVFWFVALTNAFNLLDNMDGVAAGVGAIAAAFLGVTFAAQGAWVHAAVAWALAGAAAGFLRYNFHPASIFMGDAGSLFVGSLLAGLVVASPASTSGSLVSVLFVPLAIMAVPVLDTTLVTVTRTLATRSIAQGGRDHSTHRLVALGLGERQVALLLYVFAALGGGVGLALMRLDVGLGLALGTAFLTGMSLLAAYLGRLQVRYPDTPAGSKHLTVLVTELLYKRRLAELLLDVLLIAVAYYGAYRLRFDNAAPAAHLAEYQATLGLVIAVKVTAFGLFGVYRGAWQYTGMGDLYRVLGAIGLSLAALYGYVQWRVPILADTPSILYIDALLTAALVLTARMSFKSLDTVRKRLRHKGDGVVIYGAGDGGELAVRELRNNAELGLHPVGFLDDDVRKHGGRIHGVPVVGGLDSLESVVRRLGVRRVLLGTKKLSPMVVQALRAFTQAHDLELLELDIGVRRMSGDGIGLVRNASRGGQSREPQVGGRASAATS